MPEVALKLLPVHLKEYSCNACRRQAFTTGCMEVHRGTQRFHTISLCVSVISVVNCFLLLKHIKRIRREYFLEWYSYQLNFWYVRTNLFCVIFCNTLAAAAKQNLAVTQLDELNPKLQSSLMPFIPGLAVHTAAIFFGVGLLFGGRHAGNTEDFVSIHL